MCEKCRLAEEREKANRPEPEKWDWHSYWEMVDSLAKLERQMKEWNEQDERACNGRGKE